MLIQGVNVLQCDRDACRVLADHDILIRGNRIAAVEPTGSLAGGDGCEVVPGAGMLAIPGLINTHAHVSMGIFRGLAEDVDITTWFNDYMWPLESNLTADDVFWGMQLGLAEMIEAGVTSVADHYFHMDRAAAAVEKAGTRAALGWAVFGNQGQAGIDRTASFARGVRRRRKRAGSRPGSRRTPPIPATMPSSSRWRGRPSVSGSASTSMPRRRRSRPAPASKRTAGRRSGFSPIPVFWIARRSWPTAAASHPRTSS